MLGFAGLLTTGCGDSGARDKTKKDVADAPKENKAAESLNEVKGSRDIKRHWRITVSHSMKIG